MALTYLSTQTASSDSSLSFTSGIDSTYDAYEFHFVNIHPQTGGSHLQFQVNADGQTGFNETMTTTNFRAYHNESDSDTAFDYSTTHDQAQGTSYQTFASNVGAENDESMSGILTLYAPSSTTYVKHFVIRAVHYQHSDYAFDTYTAGYINTTSAIDEIDFKFSSGNIDAGKIHLYGVS